MTAERWEKVVVKAFKILRHRHGADHPETVRGMAAIASVGYDSGDYRTALSLYDRAAVAAISTE